MNNTRSIFLRGNDRIDRVFAHDNSEIPSGAKLVFMCLLSLADKKGVCSLTQRHISRSIGISERQVRSHLKKLGDSGVIQKLKKKPKKTPSNYPPSNSYDLSHVIGRSVKEVDAKGKEEVDDDILIIQEFSSSSR